MLISDFVAYYGFYDLRMLDERCFVSTIESARARDEVPRIARALDLLGGTRRSRRSWSVNGVKLSISCDESPIVVNGTFCTDGRTRRTARRTEKVVARRAEKR